MSSTSTHRRRFKQITSQVKKLRGWVGSDASVGESLVDALNEVTALRLLDHSYADAAADAQDALTRANALVAEHGAVGPFTPADDAVRFVTATAQLARLQAGLGQPGAAAATAGAAQAWMGLLPHLDVAPYLAPRTASWLLQARAVGALTAGDVAAANAFADAAVVRAREGGLVGRDAQVLVDAALLASRARTVAGLPQDAALLAREAMTAASSALRQAEPVQQASLTGIEVESLVAAGNAVASAWGAQGRWDEATASRRAVLAQIEGATTAPSAQARAYRVRADVARDLAQAGDTAGARAAAEQAAQGVSRLAALGLPAEELLPVQFAATTALAEALLRDGEAADAVAALQAVVERDASLRHPAWATAWRALAAITLAQAQRLAGDPAAPQTQAWAEDVAAHVPSPLPVPPGVPLTSRLVAAARGVPLPGVGPAPSWSVLDDDRALSASTRAPRSLGDAVAPVAAAPDLHDEPDAVAAAPGAAPAPVPSAPTIEAPQPDPSGLTEDAGAASDPQAAWRTATQSLEAARVRNDRRDVLQASQAVVDALRPLAEAEATRWTPALIEALENLGDATFKAGDWWGSRAPKREAKALAKSLPR